MPDHKPFNLRRGSSPILVSMPHNGSLIPDNIAATMTEDGRSSRDTDWFLDRLYQLPELENASVLVAQISRFVIDLNRAETNESLYPGQTTTGLIPSTCFDGAAIYTTETPDDIETQKRIDLIWRPYHQTIETELARLRERHGFAILVEAHSIASQVPRLFPGVLPDFNFGTNRDAACHPTILERVTAVLDMQDTYSHVANGRFIGGYITRHFGRPAEHWHALQIELSQATYLNETTLAWDNDKAHQVQAVFSELFATLNQWTPS